MITLTTDGCPWMSEAAIFDGSAVSHEVTTMRGRSGRVHRSHPPKMGASGEDDRSVLCFEDLGLIDSWKKRGPKKNSGFGGGNVSAQMSSSNLLFCGRGSNHWKPHWRAEYTIDVNIYIYIDVLLAEKGLSLSLSLF